MFNWQDEQTQWIKDHMDEARNIFRRVTDTWPEERIEAAKSDPLSCRSFSREIDIARGVNPSDRYRAQVERFLKGGNSGIPARYAESFISPKVALTSAQQAAYDNILPRLSRGEIVAMLGPRGTGKTFVACFLLVQYMLETGDRGLFTTALEFFRRLRATYHRDSSETEFNVFDRFATAGLLIIDEVHQRSESDFEQNTLTELVNRRYSELKPTLLVTNHRPEALAASLGPSIVSRLREDGDVVELAGESQREVIRRAKMSPSADERQRKSKQNRATE